MPWWISGGARSDPDAPRTTRRELCGIVRLLAKGRVGSSGDSGPAHHFIPVVASTPIGPSSIICLTRSPRAGAVKARFSFDGRG
jgi:hypothetical protein